MFTKPFVYWKQSESTALMLAVSGIISEVNKFVALLFLHHKHRGTGKQRDRIITKENTISFTRYFM